MEESLEFDIQCLFFLCWNLASLANLLILAELLGDKILLVLLAALLGSVLLNLGDFLGVKSISIQVLHHTSIAILEAISSLTFE